MPRSMSLRWAASVNQSVVQAGVKLVRTRIVSIPTARTAVSTAPAISVIAGQPE